MFKPPQLTKEMMNIADAEENISATHTLPPTSIEGKNGGKIIDVGVHELKYIRELGKGSQGVVELHQHIPTGSVFAVKLIPADLEPDVRRNLLREIKNLYKCSHPNIVTLHGAFFQEGYAWIILENLGGGTLQELLRRRGPLPLNIFAEVCRQMLCGLDYLHTSGVLHRDIKPSNFLVDSARGLIKISDFGVSADLEGTTNTAQVQQTSCSTWIGSLRYMAPERLRGEKYRKDSDVWSFGVAAHELLTGNSPLPASALRAGEGDLFWELMDYFDANEMSVDPSIVPDDLARDFIQACIRLEPSTRSTVKELLGHQFLRDHAETVTKENLIEFLSV